MKHDAPAQPPASVSDTAAQARADERAARADLDGLRLAYLRAWLARVPDFTKPAQITAMINLLIAVNPAQEPKPEQTGHAQATVNSVASGDTQPAEDDAAAAKTKLDDLTAKLAASDAATVAEAKARKQAEDDLKAERKQNADIIAAKDKQIEDGKNALLQRTAYGIIGISLLAILLAGVAIYLSPNKLSALMDAGPVIVGGILGLALAQLITRPWFVPAACSLGGLIALGCGWWGYRKYQKGQLAAALQEKAEQTQAVAAKVVPAIDDTYDAMRKGILKTGEEVFTELYTKLGTQMSDAEKAAVHLIRANNKTAA